MSRGIDALDALYQQYENCDKCVALCQSRSQVVMGSGNARADIMVVGGPPGDEEDAQGVPFVGRAGRLLMNLMAYSDHHTRVWPQDDRLDDILFDDGLKQNDERFFDVLRDYFDDHVFWCDIICCHPVKNREPTTPELKACRDRLERTIYAVDPMLIIGSGKLAVSQLLGRPVAITEKRGTLYDAEFRSPVTKDLIRYPLLAILDPAHLLREGSLNLVEKQKGSTWATIQDLAWGVELVRRNYEDTLHSDFPHQPDHYKR